MVFFNGFPPAFVHSKRLSYANRNCPASTAIMPYLAA